MLTAPSGVRSFVKRAVQSRPRSPCVLYVAPSRWSGLAAIKSHVGHRQSRRVLELSFSCRRHPRRSASTIQRLRELIQIDAGDSLSSAAKLLGISPSFGRPPRRLWNSPAGLSGRASCGSAPTLADAPTSETFRAQRLAGRRGCSIPCARLLLIGHCAACFDPVEDSVPQHRRLMRD